MSTRGLYGFRKGGIDKTTYNHSDSYPEWLGEQISKFCTAVTPEQMSDFFDRIIMVDEDASPTKEQQDYCIAAGWYNPYVGEKSPAHWYNLLREIQGNMAELDKAVRSDKDFYMIDSSEFIKDSLFCEYAYIVNLDTGMLEFWEGFQTDPQQGNRYGEDPVDCEHYPQPYYPCRLALEIPLADTAALAAAVPAMLTACKED